MKVFAAAVFTLLLVAIVGMADWAHYSPLVPERIASHINPGGHVNQWVDKAETRKGTIGAVKNMALIVLGIGVVLYLTIRFGPTWAINLPNKDYWLTRKRRPQAAILFLGFFLWLFVFWLVLVVGITHAMFLATLHPNGGSDYVTLPVIGGVIACLVVWVILLIRRFSKGV